MGGLLCGINSSISPEISEDESMGTSINYTTSCLCFYQWILERFAFQAFTYRQIIQEIDTELSDYHHQFDTKIIKVMLKTFVETKMLKYFKDGYFTIPLPTLSFEITETEEYHTFDKRSHSL